MTTHGRSILEMLWEEMDDELARLMFLRRDGYIDEDWHVAEKRGGCRAWAEAIAIMTNPYDPDVDAVKQEAMERYEANHNRV